MNVVAWIIAACLVILGVPVVGTGMVVAIAIGVRLAVGDLEAAAIPVDSQD